MKSLKANEWHDTNEPGLRVLYQEMNGAYDVSLWNIGKQPKTIFIEGSFKSILPEQLYTVTGLNKLNGLDCQIYYDDKWSELDVKQPARAKQPPPNISLKEPHREKGGTEEIESKHSNSQRLAEAIEKNLEKGLGYLKEIEQARDDIFKIKAEIREEILNKVQRTIIQADEKQKQLKDRLKNLDEFEYRDLERKRQEIARQVQQAAVEIQKRYLEKMAPDALFQNRQKYTERLSAILSQVTAFKKDLVNANYPKDAISKTIPAVEYLVEETLQALQLPLPKLILPDISNPKEYERQQACFIAQMALTQHPPEKLRPGALYIDYVWQEYWNALLEYKKELSEVKPEERLRGAQSKVDGVLKDIVGNLMDAFDEGKAVDGNQMRISAYFNNQYLPRILDLAGFEEISIDIGKTKADQRLHEITGTKRGNYESGVIVEVIQRGFRCKGDKTPVRKPVVIRGEPA